MRSLFLTICFGVLACCAIAPVQAAPKAAAPTLPKTNGIPAIVADSNGATITYSLPKAGRVSIAVYDAAGKMVRTLTSGAQQSAGENSVQWDGLDNDGKAVPPGEYSWKLLLSQGMKAEFMMALGTSFGYNHWIGQHGGPCTVASDGTNFIAGGYPEGSPMLGIAGLDGTYKRIFDSLLTGAGPIDLAMDNGTVYALLTGGSLFAPAKTDQAIDIRNKLLAIPVRSLGGIDATTSPAAKSFDVAPGNYVVKMKVGQENALTGNMAFVWNGSWNATNTGLQPGKYWESIQPRLWDSYKSISPDKNGKIQLNIGPNGNDKTPFAIADMQLLAIAERLDARFGEVVASFRGADAIAWIDSKNGNVLQQVKVPQARGVALAARGVALVLSDGNLVRATRDGKTETVATGLAASTALGFDPPTGGLWVYDGNNQQVQYFDKNFKNTKTFGRKGGRQQGPYVPEDFLAVADLASDGNGGFLVAEDNSAPRRIAHFDGNGKLLKEWYGGQQFYTFAAVNTNDPNHIWMDSQWGWVMEVEVDWQKRDWKVLSTYAWPSSISGSFLEGKGMASPHYVRSLDLNKDGKKETYLISGNQPGSLLLVDEAARRLRPVALFGMVNAGQWWGMDGHAPKIETLPKPWVEAAQRAGVDFKIPNIVHQYRGFGWADANNDGQLQSEELIVGNGTNAGPLLLDNDLNLYLSADIQKKNQNPAWQKIPASGATKDGYPVWGWNKKELAPPSGYQTTREMRKDGQGNLYGVMEGSAGDGFIAPDTYGMGHGGVWPANQTDSNALIKWNPRGEKQWEVGYHDSYGGQPGRLNYPVHLAGIAYDTIGVCDKIQKPISFWTTDGLYAGGLFDRRADDGLPLRIYRWWTGGSDGFNPDIGRAAIQYDMALGGSLLKLANGDVVFIGSGWNNCPVYKVTGWDEFERQGGKISVKTLATAPLQTGTGLKGEYFLDPKLEGEPVLTQTEPRIWFDASKKQYSTSYLWPDAASTLNAYSARWSGTVEPKFTESYTLWMYGHGGKAKLWVGGRLIAQQSGNGDDWKAAGSAGPLRAGVKYPLVLEYSGAAGNGLHLNWESQSQPISHIPTSALYPEALDKSLPAVSIKVVEPLLHRKSPQPLRFLFTRTGSLDKPLTVGIKTGGTATVDQDYRALPPIVTFPAGKTEAALDVFSVPTGTADSPSLIIQLLLSPRYFVDGSGNASATVGVPEGITLVRFMEPLRAQNGLSDSRSLPANTESREWQLTGTANLNSPNGGSSTSISVLDVDQKPIATFFVYRGDPIPNVTTKSGHTNYAIFNGNEIAHADEPLMYRLISVDNTFNLSVKDGMARLRWGEKIDIERRILDGSNWRQPASVQLRTSGAGSDGVITNGAMRIVDAKP